MNPDPPALGIRALRLRRGRREVLHVDCLDVAATETLAVLGPNGAGKSTLLQAAGLLLRPTEGSVALFGELPRRSRDRVRLRRMTSTVFQEPALLDMSVTENVETALALRGIGRAERRHRAEQWLGRLGVAHLGQARAHTLSGGEAQRVSLARAFAVQPRLLLLDEPFASLDPETRSRLVSDVRTLLHEEEAAALLVTHDQTEAALLADRMLVLLEGAVAQIGGVIEVLRRPATPEVAAFIGYSLLDAAVMRRFLGDDGGGEHAARAVTAAVHPDAVELLDPDAAPDAAIQATVITVGGTHGSARVVVDVGAPLAASVEVERVVGTDLRAGAVVGVRLDAAGVVWY
ncbi:MAG: ABC transporter ATP-binding protein [Dehalococcoidia bacterium]